MKRRKPLRRHARACPAHPDHAGPCAPHRDCRDKPGNDGKASAAQLRRCEEREARRSNPELCVSSELKNVQLKGSNGAASSAHSRESGNPAGPFNAARQCWVPAFAGTSGWVHAKKICRRIENAQLDGNSGATRSAHSRASRNPERPFNSARQCSVPLQGSGRFHQKTAQTSGRRLPPFRRRARLAS